MRSICLTHCNICMGHTSQLGSQESVSEEKEKETYKNQTLYGMYLYASTPVTGRLEAGKSPSSCRPVLTQERFTAGVEV